MEDRGGPAIEATPSWRCEGARAECSRGTGDSGREYHHCFLARANERPIMGKSTVTPLNNIPLRPRLEVLRVHECV